MSKNLVSNGSPVLPGEKEILGVKYSQNYFTDNMPNSSMTFRESAAEDTTLINFYGNAYLL